MLNHKEISELRKNLLSPSLSLSYDEPLHIVKARGQYLFDANQNRYLDAVNNIQHVGHCHPKVVEAAKKQYDILNTNTRYLDETIIAYAQALTNHLHYLDHQLIVFQHPLAFLRLIQGCHC